jgi:hypothetical protein
LVGIEVIELRTVVRVDPIEVDAVFVFAFTCATILEEAVPIVVLVLLFTLAVPALTADAMDEVAV